MKKLLYILGGLFVVLLLVGGGFAFYLYNSVQSTVNSEMHVGLDRDKPDSRDSEVDMDNREPTSFLLMGVDAEESTSGRTDTIMVVTVNPEDESMRMLSLPRDTRMELPGRGEDKVNHAHAFGGADLALETVENFLDIPLDYFITVNMSGFQDMVDAVGGVTVENNFSFEQNDHYFQEGEVDLDGEEALAYVRMRKNDPDGDFGRNERQRQIVNAMVREGAQFSSITRVEDILDAVGGNVVTNLDFEKMRKLQSNYSDTLSDQQTLDIDGHGETINGVWYYQVTDEERQRLRDEFRTHLNLENEVAVNGEDEDES
ncbi:LCP family protein [Alkalicoccus saliphilus]|uniref:LytR family transcriptional regulator n=1 Tax=Alkalicoccus saliphilus TaxID=200989 RepID=A0A2T4U3I3_9BACI|nr:LCP family protein [Alkalicoccus saliphilus]PTL37915.1 LytR family transcriptional regulator [Alkalicoccus saliphilus]